MSPRRAVFLIGPLTALAVAGGLRAGDDGPVVEHGTFVLHLCKRPTGKETYEIRRDGDDLVLKADYENTDRGRKEPLTATLRLRDGRTPGRFAVKGMTSRFTQIDSEVRVEGRTAPRGVRGNAPPRCSTYVLARRASAGQPRREAASFDPRPCRVDLRP